MSYLILVRHGQSQWNKKGLWTGRRDIPLTDQGREEAKRAGDSIHDISLDFVYSSAQIRCVETLELIKKSKNVSNLQTFQSEALNERDYGALTGKNKWEIKKQYGDETFKKIRRAWDYPIPDGETLKDVYNRVVPFYTKEILPKLKSDKNILIVASGNSLRALLKYMENISEDYISDLEIATGEVLVYQFDHKGKIVKKEARQSHPNTA